MQPLTVWQEKIPERRVVVLGATGSIGRQALEVIAAVPELHAVALVARANVDEVLAQAQRCGARLLAFHDQAAAQRARERLREQPLSADGPPVRVFAGDEGVAELIAAAGEEPGAGEIIVLNGIVGAAGLRATLATLEAGYTLALANKESMVAGGEFVVQAARASGARIIPVDSEHSAIHQLLEGERRAAVSEILITGSGGPFRGKGRAELATVTPEQALKHPNWSMGPKVTIDSATLMNKGLEVIEAHHLFGMPYEQIKVVIHPQSLVHSLVRFADGALLAHLGVPDMRTPIGYALTYPARAELPMVAPLDLLAHDLTFESYDADLFPCLELAIDAGQAGGWAPVVLNAANEVAVYAFLDRRIGFLDIPALVEEALDELGSEPCRSVDDVFAADAAARAFVDERLRQGNR